MATPKQTDPQFKLRIERELRDRIAVFAHTNNRSMNAEIIATLEKEYPAPIEPETPNEAVISAATAVLNDWEEMLRAIGQDPYANVKFAGLLRALVKAKSGRE